MEAIELLEGLLESYARWGIAGLETLAISLTVGGTVIVLISHGWQLATGRDLVSCYESLRSSLGRVILVTLELLVAADIIKTVAVEFTLGSLGALGILVLIRTFLSLALEVEINGRWPWTQSGADGKSGQEHA